jgi:hypothetical protein
MITPRFLPMDNVLQTSCHLYRHCKQPLTHFFFLLLRVHFKLFFICNNNNNNNKLVVL